MADNDSADDTGADDSGRNDSGADDSGPASGAARPRKHRRVSTAAAPGTDPRPQREPLRHAENENDARLRADKPPHWG